jgi:hypothetical protein
MTCGDCARFRRKGTSHRGDCLEDLNSDTEAGDDASERTDDCECVIPCAFMPVPRPRIDHTRPLFPEEAKP